MNLLPLVKYGDPILRKKVSSVEDFSGLSPLIDDMFPTMYYEHGIGLAGNQVGQDLAILVFDISGYESDDEIEPKKNPQVFINPEVIHSEGKSIMEEGCLSVPDIRAKVQRAATITLKFQNIDGDVKEEVFTGLSARVILHEIDHLNGKFFTDYLSPSKKILIQKRLQEIALTGKASTGIIL